MVMNETESIPDINIPQLLLDVLSSRGMTLPEIHEFLNPDYIRDLHDPFLLLDMEKAVTRIGEARNKHERVAIYGDYDIDGITASAVMLEAMASLGIEAESYIPDRFEEGYGINLAALETLKERKFDLVISVDCGITSVTEAAWARENGLDLIITDHHNVPEIIPDAIAVINPHRTDDPYPFKELAGVGVAFKLVQALQKRFELPMAGQEKWLLDLVALGTVCDVVPLVGENRVLVSYGLTVLRQTRRVGVRELALVGRTTPAELTSYHLGFVLGPRMNAAGRLEHAARSLELMMTDDVLRARAIAEELDYLNDQRKADQKRIFEQACIQAKLYEDEPVLVVSGPDWSHGVVGIVASKLVELYHKPVLVAQEMGDKTKGSGRSVAGFNLVEALRAADRLFTKYGGHYFAAGFTLPTADLPALRAVLSDYAMANPPAPYSDDLITEINLVDLETVEWELLDDIAKLEPFGSQNPRPLIRIRNVRLVDKRAIGQDKTHLKLTLADQKQRRLAGVGFGLAKTYSALSVGDYIDVIGHLSKNEYNGSSTIQLMIEKIVHADNI
jgi:single-stranded-DNA-specific exonuclease